MKWILWALNQPISSSSHKIVLLLLAQCSNKKGICFPSLSYLKQKTSLSIRQIQRIIKDLTKDHYIEIIQIRTQTGRFSTNNYKLLID